MFYNQSVSEAIVEMWTDRTISRDQKYHKS